MSLNEHMYFPNHRFPKIIIEKNMVNGLKYLKLLSILFVNVLANPQVNAQQQKLSNILLFHADDMTWRDCHLMAIQM
jgi:hypothetical protein